MISLRFFTCFSLFITLATVTLAQNEKLQCSSLHDGTFYLYPKNSGKSFLSIRSGDMVKEVEMNTRDTAYWKISWRGCNYTMKLVSYTGKGFKNMGDVSDHKFIYRVQNVSSNYYTYQGFMDKVSDDPIQTDTAWLQPQTNASNKILFAPVANEGILKRSHFADTSKYAVLYIYSPITTVCQNANYYIYLDDVLVFGAENSGFKKPSAIFKIYKEGSVDLVSMVKSKVSKVSADIQFGKTYYLKNQVKWGVQCYPELLMVDPKVGKTEFASVQ
jgi:hypothetical protein